MKIQYSYSNVNGPKEKCHFAVTGEMKVKPSIYCAAIAPTEFLIYDERRRTSLCTESNLLVHASSALVMVTVQKFFSNLRIEQK